MSACYPIDYRKFSNLGRYLLEEVGPRFRSTGTIEPVDLFMIFIWKSNRAKTAVRNNLAKPAKGGFSKATTQIASALSATKDRKDRLAIFMMCDWGLRLPMASAILTILYPEDFTVYDRRVCSMLRIKFKDTPFSEKRWSEYEDYKRALCKKTPPGLSLRDMRIDFFGENPFVKMPKETRAKPNDLASPLWEILFSRAAFSRSSFPHAAWAACGDMSLGNSSRSFIKVRFFRHVGPID